jgi:hypothetical protein
MRTARAREWVVIHNCVRSTARTINCPKQPIKSGLVSGSFNASSVGGHLALVDRGTCSFVTKAKNAQNAGAIGVIIVDNRLEIPAPGMSDTDSTITIPAVMISQPDGATIEGQLSGGVNATLGLDLSIRAGADANGRGLLWTPNPVQPGSTISHWDEIATPNQLMEPAINDDLTHAVTPPQDLTFESLRDLGW